MGHWTFDGKHLSGVHAYDASGNGNRGILTPTDGTGPVRTAGKLGQRLEFDGQNDYVVVSHSSVFDFGATDNFSFAFWTSTTELVSNTYHITKGDGGLGPGYDFGNGGSGTEDCSLRDGSFHYRSFGNIVIADGSWHHIVCVIDRDAQTITLYVDGAKDITGSLATAGSPAVTNSLWFARRNENRLQGKLDDVRIYNRALSADEIKRLYNLGR